MAAENQTPPQPKTSLSQKKKIIYIVLGALIIILILAAAYFAFFKSSEEETSTDAIPSTQPASPSAQNETTYCADGEVYENQKQGYEVCIVKGWIKKEFDSSAITVGFDPKNIPEASEYAGLISVRVSADTLNSEVEKVEKGLEKTSKTTVEVDGVSATQISGTTPADDIAANVDMVYTLFTNFNRLYTVNLAHNTTSNKKIYGEFLKSWKFVKDAANPPWSDSGNILVDQPWPGDKITNPVKIIGNALAFEGVVSVRIKDADGNVLASTTIQSESGVELSYFSKDVSYNKPSTKTGTIELFTESAKDGSEQDEVIISINFP